MFKLFALLCAGIFLTMLLGPQKDGPVRYGLVPGKIPALAFDDPEKPAKAKAEEPVATASAEPVVAAPAPQPTARQTSSLIQAAYTEAEAPLRTSLTLALPLVRPDTPSAAVETPEPARTPETEPFVQYVQGTSVNVRAGPSAETESLTKLGKGEAVLVLPSDTPGWSMIRIEGDGVEGYVASRFLGERIEDGLFSSVD